MDELHKGQNDEVWFAEHTRHYHLTFDKPMDDLYLVHFSFDKKMPYPETDHEFLQIASIKAGQFGELTVETSTFPKPQDTTRWNSLRAYRKRSAHLDLATMKKVRKIGSEKTQNDDNEEEAPHGNHHRTNILYGVIGFFIGIPVAYGGATYGNLANPSRFRACGR